MSATQRLLDRVRSHSFPAVIAAGTVALSGSIYGLHALSQRNINDVPISASPKGVTVVVAAAAEFREERRYVGTLEAWQEAKVGPQLVAAYVDTVLVRPGVAVKKGEVLATLDCRHASSGSSAIAARARALEAKQRAIAGETARVQGLAERGFVSDNEIDQRVAQSASTEAQLEGLRAQLASKSLEVDDCVLRAPFSGEVAERVADAGAFARPGTSLVSVVDRSVVRLVGYAPETDFALIEPGRQVEIEIFATGNKLRAKIARRAPQANDRSRNVRFEVDIDNSDRSVPTGTTASIRVRAPSGEQATEIPIVAASVRGNHATLFSIERDHAVQKSVRIVGERKGSLFVDATLAPGTLVVVEGRSKLKHNDKVLAKIDAFTPSTARPRPLGAKLERAPSSLPTRGIGP
jgi:membrane fusion protein, multidrug efflux system